VVTGFVYVLLLFIHGPNRCQVRQHFFGQFAKQ
jgi:hypothetical protein